MLFGVYLVRKGLITPAQLVDALEYQLNSRPPIGRIAMEAGIMSVAQISAVLAAQTDDQRGFGQVAITLGFLDEARLAQLLMAQQDRQPRIAEILVKTNVLPADAVDSEMSAFRKLMSHTSAITSVS